MKKLFLITTLFFATNILFASNTLFEQANTFYTQEKYKDAILLYDSIHKNDLLSTELFYNIGNAYYKLQDWPHCILYYEKALKLNGNNEDALHNLELAQLKIVDKIESIPALPFEEWIDSIVSFLTTDHWAILSILLLWLSFLFFGIKKIHHLRLPQNLLTSFLILSFFSFIFANSQFQQKSKQTYAIIFSSSLVVKNAPSFNATDLFSIHSGRKILITDQIEQWIKIRLTNGQVGWILKEGCKEI